MNLNPTELEGTQAAPLRGISRPLVCALAVLVMAQGCVSSKGPAFDPAGNSTVFLRSGVHRGWIEFYDLSSRKLFLAAIDGDGWVKCELPKGRHLVTRRRFSDLECAVMLKSSGWREVRGELNIPENGVACYVGDLVFGKSDVRVDRDEAAAAEYYRRTLAGQRPRLVTSTMALEH